MATWTKAGSADFCLVADPKKLTKGSAQPGALTLDYKNRSMVPLTAAVLKLYSSDPAVADAKASATPAPSIHISRRPNKLSAWPPSTGSTTIGSWSPVAGGSATLNADVNVEDNAGRRTNTATSSHDVEVT